LKVRLAPNQFETKQRRYKRVGIALGVACSLTAGVAAYAEDEAQLKLLRARIEALQQELEQSRGQRDTLLDELRDTELRVGAALHNLKEIDMQLKSEAKKLNSLRNQKQEKHAQLRTHIKGMEHQARAAYATGRQEYVKMLLNQEDPASLNRVLIYYSYFYQARAQEIVRTRSAMSELTTIERQISLRTLELHNLRAEQSRKKLALEQDHARRETIVANLNRKVRDQSQEINLLHQDEQRLARLVEGLRAPPAFSLVLPANAYFRDAKGQLPLPLKARITAFYGSPKNKGDLRWKGVFMAAPAGREVRSVFRGRVAYADWLRGFGLLLILEHGDGYMTLYGHNQSLYSKVGDWVEAGQIVASVGNTGGFGESGLYFEIRHNGEPYDPLQWCKR
jgi:murein hydrolase activator